MIRDFGLNVALPKYRQLKEPFAWSAALLPVLRKRFGPQQSFTFCVANGS